MQSLFRKVRYITLVNLLTADDISTGRPAWIYDPADPRDAHVLMPEYLTCEDKSEQLAGHAIEWLTDAGARAAARRGARGAARSLRPGRRLGAGGGVHCGRAGSGVAARRRRFETLRRSVWFAARAAESAAAERSCGL